MNRKDRKMIKVKFLGTCSGTEPFADMHHCSWVLTAGGKNYWFDAGENCAHRAYCDGVEVMNTAAIFVSHAHIDHIGGMPNLLALFQKLEKMYGAKLINDNTLEIFFPSPELLPAIKQVANGSERTDLFSFELKEHGISDGLIFADENVRVSALHNAHLKEDGSGGYHSYSFLIEAEDKKIVFSGDVKSQTELDSLIGDGCDMLITETGHHRVEDVLEYALSRNAAKLRFNHHGRQIIGDRDGCERLCADFAKAHNMDVVICKDGMTETL